MILPQICTKLTDTITKRDYDQIARIQKDLQNQKEISKQLELVDKITCDTEKS